MEVIENDVKAQIRKAPVKTNKDPKMIKSWETILSH